MSDVIKTADYSFEQLEQIVLERLLEKFHSSAGYDLTPPRFTKLIGLDNDGTARRLFHRMETLGAIDSYTRQHIAGGEITIWTISARIIDIVADRKAALAAANRPPDRVAAVERWIRTHPRWSIVVIAFLGLTALATLVNQLVQLYDRFAK